MVLGQGTGWLWWLTMLLALLMEAVGPLPRVGHGGAVVPLRTSAIAPRQAPAHLHMFVGSIPTPGRKLFSQTLSLSTTPITPSCQLPTLYLISPSFMWLTATGSHDMPIKFHHCHCNPSVNTVNAGWSPVPGWVLDSGREGQTLACESL